MRVRVNVTEDDLIEADAADCERCPVTQAIGRLLAADCEVRVRYVDLEITGDGRRPVSIPLSPDVVRLIRCIDGLDDAPMAPLAFEVDLPAWAVLHRDAAADG